MRIFSLKTRKKTINEMRAYAAKLPTTPGYKLERRNELEHMCEQLQYATANKKATVTKTRSERYDIKQE